MIGGIRKGRHHIKELRYTETHRNNLNKHGNEPEEGSPGAATAAILLILIIAIIALVKYFIL